MDSKIFLQSYASKQSSNTSNGLNVELKGRRKLLPTNDVASTISQYEQYVSERESCTKIRLTCQVNPICSNVLFNSITEIVKDEGSEDVVVVNFGDKVDLNGAYGGNKDWSTSTWNSDDVSITVLEGSGNANHPTNSIRDTQLSNNGFVYHCGLDIFNNHLIRSNTFKIICKSTKDSGTFNTIADMMRDVKGDVVEETVYYPVDASQISGHKKDIKTHVYRFDDILSYSDALKTKLVKRYDGWVGFYNRSKIKTYADFSKNNAMDIERPIMYMNGGDFVDMYPTRDLYSFVPKYNKFRKRVEKNWDYCITYPSSSTTKGFENLINASIGSLKAIYFDENSIGDNGGSQLVIYSIAKHGLKEGDFVNVYKSNSSGDEMVLEGTEVSDIVDDYIFVLKGNGASISSYWYDLSDDELNGKKKVTYNSKTFTISQNKRYFTDGTSSTKYYVINGKYVNLDDESQNISYKRVVNGIECDYYVRIFSKLPNFKYASSVTSSEYDVYSDKTLIPTYQSSEYEFSSSVSKLAFSKNIYGDEIGEIVFTDDIEFSKLRDNLGRPLSSLYISFFKSNGGYKEWYGMDNVTPNRASSSVTFSHCFGKLTCGYDTSDESIYDNGISSIHKINNISGSHGLDNLINSGGTEVDYSNDKHFYGDLCSYDGYNAIETSIQPILFRFNTAQRESKNSSTAQYFSRYNYDEVEYDDYDVNNKFTIKTYQNQNDCNTRMEGYYYKPHYEIPIRAFGKLNSIRPDFLGILKIERASDGVYSFSTLSYHYLGIGDKAMLYDSVQEKYYTLVTIQRKESNYKRFFCNVYDEDGSNHLDSITFLDADGIEKTLYNSRDDVANGMTISDFKLFKVDNLDIPSYARILKDGTCRYVWRELIQNGMEDGTSAIEEYPFTNGALYVNKKVDIYVRRQDPYGEYGLYNGDDISGDDSKTDVISDNNYVKEDDIKC